MVIRPEAKRQQERDEVSLFLVMRLSHYPAADGEKAAEKRDEDSLFCPFTWQPMVRRPEAKRQQDRRRRLSLLHIISNPVTESPFDSLFNTLLKGVTVRMFGGGKEEKT